jgi:hypothetical protein
VSKTPVTQQSSATGIAQERVNLAYAATINHHSHVIHSFASNFVNVFAFFNAGAFSATIAVIPTEFGKAALKTYPSVSIWILILFALGFICSSSLMAAVFHYSLLKYWDYREALTLNTIDANKLPYGPSGHPRFVVRAWVLLIGAVMSTIIGMLLTLVVVYKVNMQ